MQTNINRLVKFRLPNGGALDINDNVLELISNYAQLEIDSKESGGLLIGYTQKDTDNIIVELITKPQQKDIRSRISFIRKDPRHFQILSMLKKQKSDYLGTWHTHPQDIPFPSNTDFQDWCECLKKESTRNGYILFLIWGRVQFKVWAGDLKTMKICELEEWPCHKGLYIKRRSNE